MLKNLHSEYSRWDADEVKVFFENEGVDLTSLLPNGMSASAVASPLMQYFYTRALYIVFLFVLGSTPYTLPPQRLCVLLVPGLQQAYFITSNKLCLPTVSTVYYVLLFSQFEVEPFQIDSRTHVASYIHGAWFSHLP